MVVVVRVLVAFHKFWLVYLAFRSDIFANIPISVAFFPIPYSSLPSFFCVVLLISLQLLVICFILISSCLDALSEKKL